ncbi:hypothetical protein QBC39DRAFT_80060 [Podospora conica]|nr:hypothetical protein QBC39DRAFT_80060 [Schizothecium conicum]
MASLPHRPFESDKPSSTNAPATSPSPEDKVKPNVDASQAPQQPESPSQTKPPANVTPIPRIGPIAPMDSISPTSPTRPKLPPYVGAFLMGKTVDDSGDIIDAKTGQVVARAAGDLPSMVGRTVSNRQGDILGDDGELLGYVADVEIERKESRSGSPPPGGKPRSLFEVMGRSNASLMVDEEGNILDTGGNVVGKFHDNNNPLHRKEREEREAREKAEGKREEKEETGEGPRPKPIPSIPNPRFADGEETRPHRRTEEERKENAEAWRKEKPGESPSDIFLDVKSTTEGIQLTIRIPTVFGGQQVKPNITFS